MCGRIFGCGAKVFSIWGCKCRVHISGIGPGTIRSRYRDVRHDMGCHRESYLMRIPWYGGHKDPMGIR